jgi:CubicO group peptidase (beta-lactamase class C family)
LSKHYKEQIPDLMAANQVPGLSITLVRDAEIFWNHGFGLINNQTGEPVTGDTLFEAASLSKPLFAVAVLKLYQQGILDLDTPLN